MPFVGGNGNANNGTPEMPPPPVPTRKNRPSFTRPPSHKPEGKSFTSLQSAGRKQNGATNGDDSGSDDDQPKLSIQQSDDGSASVVLSVENKAIRADPKILAAYSSVWRT